MDTVLMDRMDEFPNNLQLQITELRLLIPKKRVKCQWHLVAPMPR